MLKIDKPSTWYKKWYDGFFFGVDGSRNVTREELLRRDVPVVGPESVRSISLTVGS